MFSSNRIKQVLARNKHNDHRTETPKNKKLIMFHGDTQRSLLYKNHLFNINACSFNIEQIASMMKIMMKTSDSKCNAMTLYTSKCNKSLEIPSNAIQLTFSRLQGITFYVFNVSENEWFHHYLDVNVRGDADLKILQNVLKICMFYQNVSKQEMAALIRCYLLMEYQHHNEDKVLMTHSALIRDIADCSDEDILHFLSKCKEKTNMILYGTAAASIPRDGWEWMAIAMNNGNNAKWMEMAVNVFPDRQTKDGMENKYQFHMFISRNFQFNIHRWIHRQSTTPKMSLWLHCHLQLFQGLSNMLRKYHRGQKFLFEFVDATMVLE